MINFFIWAAVFSAAFLLSELKRRLLKMAGGAGNK